MNWGAESQIVHMSRAYPLIFKGFEGSLGVRWPLHDRSFTTEFAP